MSGGLIAGRTVAEWQEFARRDDCLERMVPSDLRALVAAIMNSLFVEGIQAHRVSELRDALQNALASGLPDVVANAARDALAKEPGQ